MRIRFYVTSFVNVHFPTVRSIVLCVELKNNFATLIVPMFVHVQILLQSMSCSVKLCVHVT